MDRKMEGMFRRNKSTGHPSGSKSILGSLEKHLGIRLHLKADVVNLGCCIMYKE